MMNNSIEITRINKRLEQINRQQKILDKEIFQLKSGIQTLEFSSEHTIDENIEITDMQINMLEKKKTYLQLQKEKELLNQELKQLKSKRHNEKLSREEEISGYKDEIKNLIEQMKELTEELKKDILKIQKQSYPKLSQNEIVKLQKERELEIQSKQEKIKDLIKTIKKLEEKLKELISPFNSFQIKQSKFADALKFKEILAGETERVD